MKVTDGRLGEGLLPCPVTPEEKILNNFYLTFWYAQGEPFLDVALAVQLARQYNNTWSPVDKAAAQNLGSFSDYQEMFRLPGGHGDPRGNVRKEFSDQWYALRERVKQDTQYSNTDTAANLDDLSMRMIKRDLIFNQPVDGQRRARRFSTNGDPHESLYRTAVVYGDTFDTGSPELNAVFGEVRERFIQTGPPAPFNDLVETWNESHPGELFVDPDDSNPDIQHALLMNTARTVQDTVARFAGEGAVLHTIGKFLPLA